VALLVILGYSLTKRFTWLCHFVLGLGLSLAPVGAYLAVTASFNWLPVMLGIAVLTWVSGFDIIYALQDEDFDREQQLYSIPSAIGRRNAIGVSIAIHVITAAMIIWVGTSGLWGNWYWIGAGFFTAMLFYQHWLVRPNDLSKVNMAFFTTNGVASIIFGIFVIFDILL
jgi:4-hydroxybenzoate polyprenyltransferase